MCILYPTYQLSDLFPRKDVGKFREWEFCANPQPTTLPHYHHSIDDTSTTFPYVPHHHHPSCPLTPAPPSHATAAGFNGNPQQPKNASAQSPAPTNPTRNRKPPQTRPRTTSTTIRKWRGREKGHRGGRESGPGVLPHLPRHSCSPRLGKPPPSAHRTTLLLMQQAPKPISLGMCPPLTPFLVTYALF